MALDTGCVYRDYGFKNSISMQRELNYAKAFWEGIIRLWTVSAIRI